MLLASTGEEGRYLLRTLECPDHVALPVGVEEKPNSEVRLAAKIAHYLHSSHSSGEGSMDYEIVIRVAVASG